jgi:hypothetical protein
MVSHAGDPWNDYECRATPPDVTACADFRELAERYVYLLGIYLGDGTISKAPRNVWRLRIFQDQKYPQILAEISEAIVATTGRSPGRVQKVGCIELYSNWKHWTCLLPQHGPGHKHRRTIALKDWQRRLVQRYPEKMLRGLIHSDGCRVINRVHRPTMAGRRTYSYPRYHFTNTSADIRSIFAEACELAGVDCRPNNATNVSVARRASVALLDEFIGPKR